MHKRRIGTFLGGFLIATTVFALGLTVANKYLLQKDNQSAMEQASVTKRPVITVDPNAGELITPTPSPTDPGVVIQGWTAVKVPAGALEANVSFYNPEENAGWYDLTFELILKETEEVVFTTGLIPPGKYCNKVTLSRSFEAGVYEAILHVQPYYMNEEQSPTNDLNMDIRLIVE